MQQFSVRKLSGLVSLCHMARRHQQDQQNLTFDEMMRFLDSEFQRFHEHRAGNAVRYELADVLKSAFAMFALKSPSLLDFKKQTIAEESNLRASLKFRVLALGNAMTVLISSSLSLIISWEVNHQ